MCIIRCGNSPFVALLYCIYKGLCRPPLSLKIHRVIYSAHHRAIAYARYVAHWQSYSPYTELLSHTAKTQYRKFKTNISRKEIAWPQSQYPHSSECERFMYSHNQSAYSVAGKYVDRCWELGLRPRNFQKKNTKMEFSLPCISLGAAHKTELEYIVSYQTTDLQ
jgi:hypothetical protein